MKTLDTEEAFLPTLKNTKRKMPRVPAHLRGGALCMLQGGMRTADVARAINCNVRTVRRLKTVHTGRQDGQLIVFAVADQECQCSTMASKVP